MKFDPKEKILRLSAEELVTSAAAQLGKSELYPFPVFLPHRDEDGEEKTVSIAFGLPAFRGEVSAKASVRKQSEKPVLTRRFSCSARGITEKKEEKRLLRALGFVLCYGFSEGETPLFRFLLSYPDGTEEVMEEAPDAPALESFFARLLTAFSADARYETERVTERLPSFLSSPFPYAAVREGQKDMMSAVYSAANQGEMLFAMAPTGTGKTMAVLFPALRAMGHGYIGKIFYLTPKNTSAHAACDAVLKLCECGMRIRAMHITAKERMCADRMAKGECGNCERRSTAVKTLRAALAELLSAALPVVGERDFATMATKHATCPYRLALAYAKYADIVIGDYNYLFDPHASPMEIFPRERDSLFLVDEAHNLPDRAREMYSGTLDTAFFDNARAVFADDAATLSVVNRLASGFEKTVAHLLKDDLRRAEDGKLYGFAKSANFPAPFLELLESVSSQLEKEKFPPNVAGAREKRNVFYALKGFLENLAFYDGRFLTYAEQRDEEKVLRFFCIDPSERIHERLALGRGAVFFSATLTPIDYYRSVLAGDHRSHKIEVPSPFENGSLCVGIMDKISVRASAREETLSEIARVIVTAMKPRRGNYMVFCPSYDYMEAVAKAFHALTPKTPFAVQKRSMTTKEREDFLAGFSEEGKGYFVGFCVSGGIFSEGVDLVGRRLIGTVVIGVGLPGISAERELIASYYGDLSGEGKEFAYLYPGLNRILQAAGRVIRREEDRGIAVLIDDRLRDEACRRVFPTGWRGLKYVGDRPSLQALISRFWQNVDDETTT